MELLNNFADFRFLNAFKKVTFQSHKSLLNFLKNYFIGSNLYQQSMYDVHCNQWTINVSRILIMCMILLDYDNCKIKLFETILIHNTFSRYH